MTARNKKLFGGALIAAGLMTAGSAHADGTYGTGFQFDAQGVNTAYAFHVWNQSGSFSYNYESGGPGSSTADSDYATFGNYIYSDVYIGADSAHITSEGYAAYGEYHYGVGQIELQLYAAYDQKLNVQYDFGGQVGLFDVITVNGYAVIGDGYGNASINLEAGNFYTVFASVGSSPNPFTGGQDSADLWITAKDYKLPAPGAVVLLGAAGLIGHRRRR